MLSLKDKEVSHFKVLNSSMSIIHVVHCIDSLNINYCNEVTSLQKQICYIHTNCYSNKLSF